ncbi:MAG: class I SAM-dependent methyltransferase [Gammaproteobacteria bacterium]|nr:class I SAM-dependent methyltransferase [Gammaproteobacteria bacterium]MCW5584123.1 class I SAM-dependent methyltransferase [Gammaproteobacteria bacterium]
MKNITHHSAKPWHYNKESGHYDQINEKNSIQINQTIEQILKKYKIETTLDLTCGTGSQVFWLAKRGFHAIGYDINAKMLSIAKSKAKKEKLNIKFRKGDMRITKAGHFDAVLTIFNAIGHLTKRDFEKAMRNIHANLNPDGLYIFDIFNLNFLLKDDTITKLTIDIQKRMGNKTIREIQYSTINKNGILASYDIYHKQIGDGKPKIDQAFQILQVYNAKQLKEILHRNGFKVLKQCNIDGSTFNDKKSERILVIAKKQ